MQSFEGPIKILSYNLGLLDYTLLGIVVYSNPPHSQSRIKYIPDAIKNSGADIIALQECYSTEHAAYLTERLLDTFPYIAREDSGSMLQLHNGLIVLSKYPISSFKLDRYKLSSPLEEWFATKSSLSVIIQVPNGEYIAIVNIHTTAGGLEGPLHSQTEDIRKSELNQASECIRESEALGAHGILVGDFNCGPNSSVHNFEYIQTQGYRDAFTEASKARVCELDPLKCCTWDPKNFLNKDGPHADCPADRLDHVMLRSGDPFWSAWYVKAASILFTDDIVELPSGDRCTLSDHYGLLIELACDPALSTPRGTTENTTA